MGEISNFVKEEEKEYLSVLNAILIMKDYCKDSAQTIGKFLGQTQIFYNLSLYKKNKFLSFEPVGVADHDFIQYLLDYLISGKTDIRGMFPDGVQRNFWKKSDFLYFEPILKLGITQEVIEHFLSHRFSLDDKEGYDPFRNFQKKTQISKAPPPIKPLQGSRNFSNKKADMVSSLGEINLLNAEIKNLREENEQLKAELAEKEQKIKELEQINLNEDLSNIPAGQLIGLTKINQLAKDRHGMARIIAAHLWQEEKHKDKLPKDIAGLVRKEMSNYCNDEDIPKTIEAMKRIINVVAPSQVRDKRGRPPNKSTT